MNENNRFSHSNVLNIDMDSIRRFNLVAQLFFFTSLLFEHFYKVVSNTTCNVRIPSNPKLNTFLVDGGILDESKVAVVTGSSSGMGFETSLILARNGFYIYATMRKLDGEGSK